MKPHKKNISPKTSGQLLSQNFLSSKLLAYLPVTALSITLFLVPLFPDEKLNRLKLIAFGVGLILTGVFAAVSKVFEKEWVFYRTPLDPYLLLYFVSAILYYKSSANPAVASSEFQRMIFSVGAFFIAVQVCSGTDSVRFKKMVLSGWLVGLFFISIYGILQKFGGIGRIMVPQLDRVFGTFGNPIFFAAFLIISIPIAMAWFVQSRKFWFRLFLFLVLILSLCALFYTGTRAAFLALPTSIFIFYLLLEFRQNWQWTKKLWKNKQKILIFLMLMVVAHFLAKALDPRYERFTEKVKNAIHASRMTATSQTHTLIWKDVLKMWKNNKWFGTGYGTFHIEFPQYASEELKKVFPQNERIVNDAHNEYLQILAETGLVGFIIFGAMVFVFYLTAIKNLLTSKNDSENNLSVDKIDAKTKTGNSQNNINQEIILFAGLLSGMTALLFQNIFSVDMRFIISSTYLFFTMGLLASFLSRPVYVSWNTGLKSCILKSVWIVFFVFLSGILGIGRNPKGFFVAGIYQFSKNEQGVWNWTKTPASGPGLIPELIRPYLAQKIINKTPNFFDEKLLNAAQTINDLENLVRQYPQQWKYWEKLGFALAKEIQRKEPDGKKVNDLAIAEKAVAAYLKAYELNPSAEGPPNNLGNIYYTINRRHEAIEWWKRAIQSNPDKIDARLNLGLAYYNEGKIKESAIQLEEVIKRDPKNEKAIVMLKRMVE